MSIVNVTCSNLFKTGRENPLVAIVLHSYSSGLEALDAQLCSCIRPRPTKSPGCHTSAEWGIGVDGQIHHYGLNTDTFWGFYSSPPNCPPSVCPQDPCLSCTGTTPDQFRPDINGNLPPIAFPVDSDGTSNSSVSHVFVTGIPNDFEQCCRWREDPDNYHNLVDALCEIFAEKGLVPSLSTLLIHCNELACIEDIQQLVDDVNACLALPPPVLPPCTCQISLAQFCAALATVPSLLTPATVALGPDCAFHPIPITDVTIIGVDTPSVDITVLEGPDNTFTISAVANICPQLATLTTDAVPATVALGPDCIFHPIPAQVPPTPAEVCAALATFPTDLTPATLALGPDCIFHPLPAVPPVDICPILAALPAGAPGVAGVDSYVGPDCLTHLLPVSDVDICAELNSLPIFPGTLLPGVNLIPTINGAGGTCDLQAFPTFCEQLTNSPPPTGAPLVDGNLVLGSDCQFHAFTATTGGQALVDCANVLLPDGSQVVTPGRPVIGDLPPGTAVIGNDCNAYTIPAATPFTLLDCAGVNVPSGSEVITPANLFNAAPTPGDRTPRIIVAPDLVDGCPIELTAPTACDATTLIDANNANFNAGYWALTQGPLDTAPTWRKLGGGLLFGDTIGGGAIDVNAPSQAGARYWVTDQPQTINAPTSDCSRTEIYIKNVGTNPITITGVGTTIDDQPFITLDGKIVGGYSFGNDGGESVHLVWHPTQAQWLVF